MKRFNGTSNSWFIVNSEVGWRRGPPSSPDTLKRVAPALTAMTIATSSFLRPPHRLWGHPGCGHWLTGITRTERRRTDMRQHGTALCRHSPGAGTTERADCVREDCWLIVAPLRSNEETSKQAHTGGAEKTVRDIRRATRRHHSPEEKIRRRKGTPDATLRRISARSAADTGRGGDDAT